MKWVICFIIAEAILFPLALVWALQAPGPVSTTALVIVSLGATLGIIGTALRGLWNPVSSKYPGREPAPDAVRRSFQSFSYGMLNLGFSIHVAADDEYLHLTPLKFFLWFGAVPASIPWSVMQPIAGSSRKVRLDGQTLQGPKWCMELAHPTADDG